jgi:hypothetical protein
LSAAGNLTPVRRSLSSVAYAVFYDPLEMKELLKWEENKLNVYSNLPQKPCLSIDVVIRILRL